MPNWCNNNASISHLDRSKVEALLEAVKEGNFCKYVIPVPRELADAVADGSVNEILVKEFGYSNWYDFCVNRWGTKWDVDAYEPSTIEIDEYNTIYFGFDSAWSPPIGVYEALVDQGFDVCAQYYEPGMAYCGEWNNGSDDYYDISGMDSETVRDTIPDFLDDQYGISECMAEYEERDRLDEELYRFTKEGGEAKGLELKTNE